MYGLRVKGLRVFRVFRSVLKVIKNHESKHYPTLVKSQGFPPMCTKVNSSSMHQSPWLSTARALSPMRSKYLKSGGVVFETLQKYGCCKGDWIFPTQDYGRCCAERAHTQVSVSTWDLGTLLRVNP